MAKVFKSPLIYFLLIFIVSLLIFYPTFNLSLYGDDWLVFWVYKTLLGPDSSTKWNHISYFLTTYGPQIVIMGILKSIYGFNSTLFYITSYLFRLLAAFSLYPVTFYLTKSKLSAFFAVLFFSITAIGLEATEYLAHMPSYISLAFFSLFLYFFLKSREQLKKYIYLLPTGLLFYLTFVFSPIRMTGLLLFIFLIEIFWFIQNRNKVIFRNLVLRLSLILVIFILIFFTGHPFFYPSEPNAKPTSGSFLITKSLDSLTGISSLLQQRSDFPFYPIITFGAMFIPETIIPDITLAGSPYKLFFTLIFSYLLFLGIFLLIKLSIYEINNKFYKIISLLGFIWTLFSSFIFFGNQSTLSSDQLIQLLFGGYLLILIFSLLVKYYRNSLVSTSLAITSWSLLSFIVPWFWSPTNFLSIEHRYLIGSAIGVAIFLATILSLAKKSKSLILTLFSFLIFFQIISAHLYIQKLLYNHNQQISNKIWSSIPYISEVGKGTEPRLFYFEGDATNAAIIHDVIGFGFPFHMRLLYNLTLQDSPNIATDQWPELVSAVTDGKYLKAHSYDKPLPLDHIYAFHLQGKDNLINITDIARQKLTELLQHRQ